MVKKAWSFATGLAKKIPFLLTEEGYNAFKQRLKSNRVVLVLVAHLDQGLDYGTGTDAAGADLDVFGITTCSCNSNLFEVRQPPAAVFVMGMAYIVSSSRFFSAYFAHF